MKTTIEIKTERETINFLQFKDKILFLMNTDKLDGMEDEYVNEWYEMFKTTKYDTVFEWALFWFCDVNSGTHDYWIDHRGKLLYKTVFGF